MVPWSFTRCYVSLSLSSHLHYAFLKYLFWLCCTEVTNQLNWGKGTCAERMSRGVLLLSYSRLVTTIICTPMEPLFGKHLHHVPTFILHVNVTQWSGKISVCGFGKTISLSEKLLCHSFKSPSVGFNPQMTSKEVALEMNHKPLGRNA